jgi:hypothetical protein
MATVRITKDLTGKIITKITDQFRLRRNALKRAIDEGFKPMIPEYRETLLALILEEHKMPQEVYDAIPTGWCPTTRSLRAIRLNDVDTQVLGNVECIPSIKIPEALQYQYESLRFSDVRVCKFAEYAAVSNRQLAELDREESEVKDEARRLLNSCGTLKQALDAWPHLMQLLPNDVLMEHNRTPAKRAKAKPVTIDSDKLTAAVVKANMAEAALKR